MTDPVVPDGLSSALRGAGLVLAGPAGTGSGGPRWTARSADGTRWGVTVVVARSAGHVEHLEERGALLALLDDAGLATTLPPLRLPGRRLVALHGLVAGTDLATVRAARPAWTAAEVVGVLVPLAHALARLHDAGLAHGDVSPANVVLRADGRPVLVDLLCGDDLLQQGTPGVAAPERPRGARPAGDVHALAATGLLLLGAGGDGQQEAAVREVLEAATDLDPDGRPSAAELARDLGQVCAPAPALLPDAAVLARLALQRLADARAVEATQPRSPRRARRARHRGARDRRGLVVGGALTTGGLALASVLAGATLGVPLPAWATLTAGRDHADARHEPHPVVGPTARTGGSGGTPQDGPDAPVAPLDLDPAAAAVRLTAGRGAALVAQDPVALAALTVPGSPAARTDASLVRGMLDQRPAGNPLSLDIRSVQRTAGDPQAFGGVPQWWRPVPGAPGAGGGPGPCPGVLVDASLRAAEATGPNSDEAAAATTSSTTTTVVLRLCPTSTGWRVSEVGSA